MSCQHCRSNPSAPVGFRKVTGALMLTMSSTIGGELCESCARRIFHSVMLHNLFLGWWSGVGLISTPILLVKNTREMSRFRSSLAGESATRPGGMAANPDAIRSLPWAKLIGIRKGPDIGHAQLTLPVAIGMFASLGLLVSLIGVVTLSITDGNNTPAEAAFLRRASWTLLLVSIATLALCIWWNMARKGRKDRAEDILVKVLPSGAIFSLDTVHVAAFAMEAKRNIRLVVLLQNCTDAPADVNAEINSPGEPAPLHLRLGPSEVQLAYCHLTPHARTNTTLTFRGNVRSTPGRQTRFGEAAPLSSNSRERSVALLSAIGGHFSFSLGSGERSDFCFMNRLGQMELARIATPTPATGTWRTLPLWTESKPQPPQFAATAILKLLQHP